MFTFRKFFGKSAPPRRSTHRQARRPARRSLLLEELEERRVPTVVFQPQFPKESLASNGPYTVLNSPTVYLIFWGPNWTTAQAQQWAGDAQAILGSPYLFGVQGNVQNSLTEYGSDGKAVWGNYWIDNPTSTGDTIPNGYDPSGNNNDANGNSTTADMQTEVANAIKNSGGTIAAPPNNAAITQSPIYVVVTDPANSLSGGQPTNAGYNVPGTYGSSSINMISFGTSGSVQQFFDERFSHELAERITDPAEDGTGVNVNYSTSSTFPAFVNVSAPNVNNNPSQAGNQGYLNNGGQIGDGEQEPGGFAHYAYQLTGTSNLTGTSKQVSAAVQPYWSALTHDSPQGSLGAFIVPDGNSQSVYLQPIWNPNGSITVLPNPTNPKGGTVTGPVFTGKYNLLIYGDNQSFTAVDDTIIVNADDTQVQVTLDGQKFLFATFTNDGGQIQNITIEPGLGTNTVTIQKLASDQTVWVEDGSFAGTSGNVSDTVTVGNNGDMRGVLGNVFVTGINNPGAVATLNLDDSKDLAGVGRTATILSLPGLPYYDVSFSGLGTVYYTPGNLQALNVSGGIFGNTFNVLGTGGSFTTVINTGLNDDNVAILGAQGPVTINGNGNPNQVTVGDPGIGLQDITGGDVVINNGSGATNLTVDDAADPTTTPDTINFGYDFGDATDPPHGAILGLLSGQNSVLYEEGGLSQLTVKTPAVDNTVNIATTLAPTYLISGGSRSGAGFIGNDTVTVGQTSSIAGFNGISGTVQGIQGDLYIENPPGLDTVVVDNSQDPTTSRQVTLSTWKPPSPAPAPLDNTDPFGRISGLTSSGATINYELNDIASDIVIRGGGQSNQPGNIWTVTGGSAGQTIRLFTGPGNDPVNLEATARLFYLEPGFTSSSVSLTVGAPSGTGRTMQNIQGNVYDQEGIGSTSVVDDSADTNAVTATLSQVPDPTGTAPNSVYERIQGLSPGDVYLPETDTSDTVLGGSPTSGTNVFTINGTLPETPLVVQTGTGQDQVNVNEDEGNGFTINSHSALDTVTLGNASSLQKLSGFGVVNGLQGTTNVVVDDSQDPAVHSSVTLTGSTLDGLAPTANSPWLTYSGLGQLVINAGTPSVNGVLTGAGNTFTVTGTAAMPKGTTLSTGGGTAAVNVGDANNTLGGLLGALAVNGKGPATTLKIVDSGNNVSENYTVWATSIRRSIIVAGVYNYNIAAINYFNVGKVAVYVGTAQTGLNQGAVYNTLDVVGAAAGTVTDLYGNKSGGQTAFAAYPYGLSNAGPILGPVHFHASGIGLDTVSYVDYFDPAAQTYTMTAGQMIDNGFAPVTYDGSLYGVGLETSVVGGSKVNVLSTAAIGIGTQVQVNAGDVVTVGSQAPNLGGTLAGLAPSGILLIQSIYSNSSASVILDDSADTRTGKQVTFSTVSSVWEVNGLATQVIELAMATGSNVQVLGGSPAAGQTGGNTYNLVDVPVLKSFKLSGGTGNDTYVVGSAVANPATIADKGSSNTLVGPNVASTWSVTGANSGSLGKVKFSNIQNLAGGSAVDVFKFGASGSLAGSINGGGGGDWLDYSALPATILVTVNLVTGSATKVAGGVSNIANVRGGQGNNTLTGNGGNILVGGGGSNTLVDAYAGSAASGRSLLIGGTGSSNLTASAAGDILIAGTTSFDANYAALQSILAEWQSADSYLLRFQRLEGLVTGGLNGKNKLVWGTTVKDNDLPSVLNGGAGLDWFFAGGDDTINNLNTPSKEHLDNNA
jgi:hypothetical protein